MKFFNLFEPLFNNVIYVILIIAFISRLKGFKKMLIKDKFETKDKIFLGIFFGLFGVLGTYLGTNVDGAIANTRNVGVIVGGVLGGPLVGLLSGSIAGIHRFLIDIDGITTFPCAITTFFSGILAGLIYKYSPLNKRWLYGMLMGLTAESVSMLLILLYSKPFERALNIVKSIFLPMPIIVGGGIAVVLLILSDLYRQRDEMQAEQAHLALKIANKTLPYFREYSYDSLKKACEIIREEIKAAAVSITDNEKILAHVGLGSDHHIVGDYFSTEATKSAIENNEIKILYNKREIGCKRNDCPLKSAIIVPLTQAEEVVGALKIYFPQENLVTLRDIFLAKGLSQLISTQIEISKIEKLKIMAKKAELKVLQAQINPHFLFNVLNTIMFFTRTDPEKARKLILNFSSFLRYNLEIDRSFVSIKEEIQHVKSYFEIEKARYGDKISLDIFMQEDINFNIPPLIIQPLVENSIKHGIMEGKRKGKITINIGKTDCHEFFVEVSDDGKGIDEETIKKVYNNSFNHSVGLSNVHNRLKLTYGNGLTIKNTDKGTKISFKITERGEKIELYNS